MTTATPHVSQSPPGELTHTPLLQVAGLTVQFPVGRTAWATALHGVDLALERGEILGLVGESGCGKSLTSLAIMGLLPPNANTHAQTLTFDGQDLSQLDEPQWQRLRGNRMALIPQDPMTSLNPVYSVGEQIAEVLRTHKKLSHRHAWQRAVELMEQVRIPNAAARANDYPHQFSGGMRQRVMIAAALSCDPALLIADEPTTALDVTVQAQILDLLQTIRQERDTSILFITHDLGVVAELCDRVAVMYAGQLVEEAPVERLFAQPSHPYTQGLLQSIPQPGHTQPLQPISGQPPSIVHRPEGCAFRPRCPQAFAPCSQLPDHYPVLPETHFARCFLWRPACH